MKNMALIFFTALALSISCAQAAPKKNPEQKFFEHKQKIIERLKQRLACVSAAQDEMQLQACRPVGQENTGGLGRDNLFKGTGQDVIR